MQDLDELGVDAMHHVYAVHNIFAVSDHSGCVHHASKTLLLSGVRTGGKSMHKDICEARDTLTRWLQLHTEHMEAELA